MRRVRPHQTPRERQAWGYVLRAGTMVNRTRGVLHLAQVTWGQEGSWSQGCREARGVRDLCLSGASGILPAAAPTQGVTTRKVSRRGPMSPRSTVRLGTWLRPRLRATRLDTVLVLCRAYIPEGGLMFEHSV